MDGGVWTARVLPHCLPTREGWDGTALGEQRTGQR